MFDYKISICYNLGMNTFLLSWDMLGPEAVINVTEIEKQTVWDTLRDTPSLNTKLQHIVSMMMLRARSNTQRHYEIYTVNMEDGITEEDVREMFETGPQQMADLIRERGNRIYSNRFDKNEAKIV